MKEFTKKIYQKLLKLCTPSLRLKIIYFRIYHKWPNLEKPNTFNEKIIKRILFDKNPRYANLSDKFLVRDYIGGLIGKDVLIPLIMETKKPEELLIIADWCQTVVKPNHAAGLIEIFSHEPSQEKKNSVIKDSKEWLKLDFSDVTDEWHYSLIEPRILMEKKITHGDEIPRDYKFHCFKQKDNTIVYVMQVIDGRFSEYSKGYYYNSLNNCVWHHGAGHHHLSNEEKNTLNEAIKHNEKIMADGFNYVRIDWYIVDRKLYFGELTFTSGAGRTNGFGSDLEKIMSDLWVEP